MPEFLSPQAPRALSDHSLLELLTELVDAHVDTVELALAKDDADELEWAAHCDYLRALQRLGNETLARYEQPGASPKPTASSPLKAVWRTASTVVGALLSTPSPRRVAYQFQLNADRFSQ